ncbi:MAG: hypothetical protein Q9177_004546 [Variospora cf. flavescens]
MSNTIIYFLRATSVEMSPLPGLINRITTHYNPTILPTWSLQQLLFRSTPSPAAVDGNPKAIPPRYLQLVTLPDYPNDTLVAITPTAPNSTTDDDDEDDETTKKPSATVISIPAGPSTDEFTQLLLTKFGPLWQRRRVVAVIEGSAMEVGGFRVRVGELRTDIGAAQVVRGVIAEVSHVGQSADEEEGRDGEGMARAFWDGLGVEGAREFRGGEVGKGDDGFGNVRLWCQVLMLNDLYQRN